MEIKKSSWIYKFVDVFFNKPSNILWRFVMQLSLSVLFVAVVLFTLYSMWYTVFYLFYGVLDNSIVSECIAKVGLIGWCVVLSMLMLIIVALLLNVSFYVGEKIAHIITQSKLYSKYKEYKKERKKNRKTIDFV